MLEAHEECVYALAMLPAVVLIKLIELRNRIAFAQRNAIFCWRRTQSIRFANEAERTEEKLCVKSFGLLNDDGGNFPVHLRP
jgi:hypothetical protein